MAPTPSIQTGRTPCASATRGHSAKRRSAASDYGGDDARIITDQVIDNSLCGYRFAGLPAGLDDAVKAVYTLRASH